MSRRHSAAFEQLVDRAWAEEIDYDQAAQEAFDRAVDRADQIRKGE